MQPLDIGSKEVYDATMRRDLIGLQRIHAPHNMADEVHIFAVRILGLDGGVSTTCVHALHVWNTS